MFSISVVAHAMTLILLTVGKPAASLPEVNPVDVYDVAWTTASADSSGSMPLGNGDVGLNVWVEEDGDLLFYISKTDAWDENGRLVKLGRVRVTLTPNPFVKDAPFLQVLRLSQGAIEIAGGDLSNQTAMRIWVDANRPEINVEIDKAEPFEAAVSLELWRTEERPLQGDELFSAYGLAEAPHPVVAYPDTVLPDSENRIVWFHRNEHSMWREALDLQGMGGWAQQASDPLLYRTFGGAIGGEGFVSESPIKLHSSAPSTKQAFTIHVHTARTATADEWASQLQPPSKKTKPLSLEDRFKAHCAWWSAFWARSWIRVTGTEDADIVSRGYALQRFISACAGRGAYPIKFNGSIFTVDTREPGKSFDADYRSWGGPYWFQNTRLAYWPMLASGDLDLLAPLFKMYLDALPFAKARTQVYFGHEGAFFPETMYFWGGYANDNYGWKREGKPVSEVDNRYIRYYFSGALELLAIMIDCQAYNKDRQFAERALLPMADGVIAFYDRHYPRDAAGKLLFKPAQALETWQDVVNPLPEIAGLQWVLDGLLALPPGLTTEAQRATWQRLRDALPPLPTKTEGGKKILAPAQEVLEETKNSENPELYAVFPYRLFGVGKPDLDMARLTFEGRRVKGDNGWRQDDTQAAFLGLAAQARQDLAERFANKHAGSRFPAFWGPNFDWIPDQDHGCNGLMALQTMLLQADGGVIRLFPAWPKEWDVEFKLHAPWKTTIEGVYRAGKLERLKVLPPERRKDVTVLDPQ